MVKTLIGLWTASVLAFLYFPLVAVVLASFSRQRYFRFPMAGWSTKWYEKASESLSVRDLVWTSLTVAVLVTVLSVVLAFFGALAFARYDWKGRKLYQRLVLLPIFFPQAVLGLALLLLKPVVTGSRFSESRRAGTPPSSPTWSGSSPSWS